MNAKKPCRLGFVLALGALVALAAAPALARGGRGGPPSVKGLEHRIESLDLGDEARAKVDAILDETRDEERALRTQMRAAHRQMRTLLGAEALDEEAVFAQADRLGDLKTQAQKQHLRALLQIQALLTPEQREQLRSRPDCGR